jgi:ABC-type uncharacterized transport system substrate-binding protein
MMAKFILLFVCLFSQMFYTVAGEKPFKDKKVLYVDSYHDGYEWSDGITSGIKTILDPSGVELKIVRMDTKRNTSEKFKKAAALKAKKIIDEFKPDLVIASDDNASKYLVMPYYKDKKLPFVFCGINWDASIYGYPYSNATGMIEVAPVRELVENLKAFSKGGKIGYLTADVATSRKEGEYYRKLIDKKIIESYVKNQSEWEKEFLKMQDQVDMIIIGNKAGINDWDQARAEAFILKNIKKPTGCIYDFMIPYSMLGFIKSADEQGTWAAETALKILEGTSPSLIPIAQNSKGGLMINLKYARKLKIKIPYEMLDSSMKVIY